VLLSGGLDSTNSWRNLARTNRLGASSSSRSRLPIRQFDRIARPACVVDAFGLSQRRSQYRGLSIGGKHCSAVAHAGISNRSSNRVRFDVLLSGWVRERGNQVVLQRIFYIFFFEEPTEVFPRLRYIQGSGRPGRARVGLRYHRTSTAGSRRLLPVIALTFSETRMRDARSAVRTSSRVDNKPALSHRHGARECAVFACALLAQPRRWPSAV